MQEEAVSISLTYTEVVSPRVNGAYKGHYLSHCCWRQHHSSWVARSRLGKPSRRLRQSFAECTLISERWLGGMLITKTIRAVLTDWKRNRDHVWDWNIRCSSPKKEVITSLKKEVGQVERKALESGYEELPRCNLHRWPEEGAHLSTGSSHTWHTWPSQVLLILTVIRKNWIVIPGNDDVKAEPLSWLFQDGWCCYQKQSRAKF